MRSIPWQATHQFGVFGTQQALAAGWTHDALRHAVRSGRLLRIRNGYYCEPVDVAAHPRDQQAILLGRRGVAAALAIPDAAVSHAAALAVHRLPLYRAGELPCITKPRRCRTMQVELHLHRKRLEPRLLDRASDVALTSVARSCVDVACELGLRAAVIAADAALHKGLTSPDELLRARMTVKGDVGSPIAGLLLDLVDGRSESPLESLSRINMIGGVPRPWIQPWVYTQDGVLIGRCDFGWPEYGVLGEADGRGKYLLRGDALDREKRRADQLGDTDAVIARWGWELAQDERALQEYLAQRLAVGRERRALGLSPRWIVRPYEDPLGRL